MSNYTAAQDDVRAAHGIARTGAQMIDSWAAFIEECADDYTWNISEYRNELRSRNDIEMIVSSER